VVCGFEEEDATPKVEPRQSQLAKVVAWRDILIADLGFALLDELDEVGELDALGDEARFLLRGQHKVRLVLDEIGIGSQESSRSLKEIHLQI